MLTAAISYDPRGWRRSADPFRGIASFIQQWPTNSEAVYPQGFGQAVIVVQQYTGIQVFPHSSQWLILTVPCITRKNRAWARFYTEFPKTKYIKKHCEDWSNDPANLPWWFRTVSNFNLDEPRGTANKKMTPDTPMNYFVATPTILYHNHPPLTPSLYYRSQ